MLVRKKFAVAAHERGEKVELRKDSLSSGDWRPFSFGLACKCCCQFRLAATPDSYRVNPDEPLKIEAGKFYRNKRGEKVVILSVVSKHREGFPVIGEVYEGDRVLMTRLYRADGTTPPGYDEQFALVSEWADSPAPYDNWQHLPAWANWQVQMKNGQWFFSSDKPKNYDNLAAPFGWYLGENGHGSLPSKYYPTNYSDHWEASLQERPKQ